MSGEGSQGNREVPPTNRPLEEGGPWGKHGFPRGSEPEASDAHAGLYALSVVPRAPNFVALRRVSSNFERAYVSTSWPVSIRSNP